MSDFVKTDLKTFETNPFELIDKQWMLITAKNGDKVNAMTASWGGMGIMWNKKVVYVFIRPQRYTREFVDVSDTFSLCFLDETYRKTLNYFGTASGRDEDKISKQNMHILDKDGTPFFEESEMVILCKKLYRQRLASDGFIIPEMNTQFYQNDDHHYMYIAEIQDILKKK